MRVLRVRAWQTRSVATRLGSAFHKRFEAKGFSSLLLGPGQHSLCCEMKNYAASQTYSFCSIQARLSIARAGFSVPAEPREYAQVPRGGWAAQVASRRSVQAARYRGRSLEQTPTRLYQSIRRRPLGSHRSIVPSICSLLQRGPEFQRVD